MPVEIEEVNGDVGEGFEQEDLDSSEVSNEPLQGYVGSGTAVEGATGRFAG